MAKTKTDLVDARKLRKMIMQDNDNDSVPRRAAEPARNIQLLKIPEVAARLSLSVTKVWQMVYSGELDSLKIDSSRRIPDYTVDEYIARGVAAEEQARRAGSAA
jgi:excisionase family DNA binding protein